MFGKLCMFAVFVVFALAPSISEAQKDSTPINKLAVAPRLSRFEQASLPEGCLGRWGSDRFTTFRRLESLAFVKAGQGQNEELQGWDGETLYRWQFPSGQPLPPWKLPQTVKPNRWPFAYSAQASHQPLVAWIRFHEDKEILGVWDFRQQKLILERDITVQNKDLDYQALVWSEDGRNLITVLNDKTVHIYDLQGKLLEQTRAKGKEELELPSGQKIRNDLLQGFRVRQGKSSLHISLVLNRTELEQLDRKLNPQQAQRAQWSKPAKYLLQFKDLDSNKIDQVPLQELNAQIPAVVSPEGRYLVLLDSSRIRIWEIHSRRELPLPQTLPEINRMILSPGADYLQFQRDPIAIPGTSWHSLETASGTLRLLSPAQSSEAFTLGLGATGFCVGKDQFIGITGRSLDRWDLKTGRHLEGTSLPETPHEVGSRGYDECLLLKDDFRLIQFASYVIKSDKPNPVFRSTWRLWSPQRQEALQELPNCTWQRGAAVLSQGRFLYFATPGGLNPAKSTEVAPNVTLSQRGVLHLYFGQTDRVKDQRLTSFQGQWSTLQGVSREGQLVLLGTSSSTWIQSSRHSQMTWYDPEAQPQSLLEFYSGEPIGDPKHWHKSLAGRPAHLSVDGRFLLLKGDKKVELYEPYILRKTVKEIVLPARPNCFAFSPDGRHIACQLEDSTVLLLDGQRLSRWVEDALTQALKEKGLQSDRDLRVLVDQLAADSGTAYRAARLLSLAGDAGVTALRQGMNGKQPEAREIAGWLRDLENAKSSTREQAEATLANWGTVVERALQSALQAKPSPDTEGALLRLLSRLERQPYGKQELAQARAVMALTWSNSLEATRLLTEWANKYPSSLLGTESKYALSKP